MKTYQSFQKLEIYIKSQNYKGWDPFDGLNSKLFKAMPLFKNSRFFRLAWLQLFKRNPINLRSLVKVPKEYNNKGLGLFLNTYCNLYRIQPKKEYLNQINFFANILIENQSKGYSGACWGYNFDWQARAFFQPKGTPTVVATSFITEALFKAYDITKNETYKKVALSTSKFIVNDLNRTYDTQKELFSFSYSPQDQSQVYNASLLGARLLAMNYHYTKNEDCKLLAEKAVKYVCQRQQEDGSWAYGNASFHHWKDNFHTGFNLECIADYQKYTQDFQFQKTIIKGVYYYVNNFFTEEGMPKYYNTKTYPVDVHAPAQLVVTLYKLKLENKYKSLIDKVLNWTINHMQSPKGYFFYQVNKIYTNKIPYMRWTQAWMLYGLSYKLLIEQNNENLSSI